MITCIKMSKIEEIKDTEFDKLLQQVHWSKLDVVDSRINDWLELLGVVSDPTDDRLSTSEMPWVVSRTVFHSWMLPFVSGDCLNWLRLSIIQLSELFTYLNEFLVAAGHRGSDKRGFTVHELDCAVKYDTCIAILVATWEGTGKIPISTWRLQGSLCTTQSQRRANCSVSVTDGRVRKGLSTGQSKKGQTDSAAD